MNKLFFFVLLVAGIVVLTVGVIESDSVASDVSRLFTGEPTDRALWLMVGGGVGVLAASLGLTLVAQGKFSSRA
ncbi:MAG: DUF3185 family protein [Planctomycetota bacterium]|nr:DUF3185 family protein [Planctomycetota bacterium]